MKTTRLKNLIMMTVRLKNLELGVEVFNHMNPKKRLDVFLLPEIRFSCICGMFYYLSISWLTFGFGVSCVIKR
jgi:hypothetical protein